MYAFLFMHAVFDMTTDQKIPILDSKECETGRTSLKASKTPASFLIFDPITHQEWREYLKSQYSSLDEDGCEGEATKLDQTEVDSKSCNFRSVLRLLLANISRYAAGLTPDYHALVSLEKIYFVVF